MIESRRWRDRLFEQRAEPPGALYPQIFGRIKGVVDQFMIPGMGGGGSLALNQLLVTMDGINEPPFKKKFMTNRLNTFLDALYIVPRKAGPVSLRLRPPKPRKEEIYFIGACNVPLETLDPALTRPGRMGRHIYFRTPTWEDRRDIFDLYITKVAHDEELDTPKKRDELARVTSGYSPAMIDQVCSMALTYAHADGRPVFGWDDIVEAMTTVEAGVAIGQEYPPHEERATAIHEAGHAVCSHLYNENLLSTRLSIRKRGSSGGHHQAMEIEERFADWRSEMFGRLIHILGAMAAEVVFYGQNTTGVGGDVRSVTWLAGRMVGFAAMAPQRVDLSDRIEDPERRDAEEDRVMERFERIGTQIMHRSGGGVMDSDPMQAVVNDPPEAHARSPGCSARPTSSPTTRSWPTRTASAHVADVLVAKREIYGDDVVALLDEAAAAQARDRRARRGRMAGDLIPPPSPAGRPEPDSSEKAAAAREAGGLWAADGAGAGRSGRGRASRRPTPEPRGPGGRAAVPRPLRLRAGRAHRRRARRHRPRRARWRRTSPTRPRRRTPGRRGSRRRPTPRQGARRSPASSPRATATGGKLLVGVDASRLEVEGVPLDGVALETRRQRRVHRGRRRHVHAQRARRHGLDRVRHAVARSAACSSGARRSSWRSTRSTTSTALDMVVALLPPSSKDVEQGAGGRTRRRRSPRCCCGPEELRDRLRDPAHRDDPAADAEGEGAHRRTTRRRKVVSALTTPNVFAVTFQQAQDAKTYLVLRPPRALTAPSPPGCARCACTRSSSARGAARSSPCA